MAATRRGGSPAQLPSPVKLLACPLDDAAALPPSTVAKWVGEATFFCVTSLVFMLWVAQQPGKAAFAFLPLILQRALAGFLDVFLLCCGGGHSFYFDSLTPGRFAPSVLRMLDAVGCTMSLLIGGLWYASQSMAVPLPVTHVMMAFPLWVSGTVTLIVMVVLSTHCVDWGFPLPLPTGHPVTDHLRTLWTHMAWHVPALAATAATVPLALKLDHRDVSWQTVFVVVYAALIVTLVPLIVIAAAGVVDRPAPKSRTMLSLVGLLQLILGGGLAIAVIETAREQLFASDEWVNKPGAPPEPLLHDPQAVHVPYLCLTVLVGMGSWLVGSVLLPPWRRDYCALVAAASPFTAAAQANHQAASPPNHVRNSTGPRAPRVRLPRPTQLVKCGYHLYRRVTADDDVEALRLRPAPPMHTPVASASATAVDASSQPSMPGAAGSGFTSSLDDRVPSPVMRLRSPARFRRLHVGPRLPGVMNAPPTPVDDVATPTMVTVVPADDPAWPHTTAVGVVAQSVQTGCVAGTDPSPSANMCKICYAAEADAVVMECGHGGLCMECCRQVMRSSRAQRVCPLCRSRISMLLRVLPPRLHTSLLVDVLCDSDEDS